MKIKTLNPFTFNVNSKCSFLGFVSITNQLKEKVLQLLES